MAKISFVLPAYKRRFLKTAIESILTQTYRDFELVVVDDCSPESLQDVVCQYSDTRLIYQRNEKNIGAKDLVAAWNHAMKYATGEWCVLASDDDVYCQDYALEMIALTEKYPTVDLVHCRNCEIDASGTVTSIGGPRSEWESGAQMLYNSSILRVHQRIADLMFRRSAYDDLGGFSYYPLAWYADFDIAIRLAFGHGAACSPKILFKFRRSGENISARGGDVAAKIEAGIMFEKRVNEFIRECASSDPDDRLLLLLAPEGIEREVYKLIDWNLGCLPFYSFIRTLIKSNLSKETKKKLLIHRISLWLNARRYFPGWRGPRF